MIPAQDEPEAPPADQRLQGLDLLRGLAALSVCWFHLTNANPSFQLPEIVRSSGAQGWRGVACFFVLSGFVVPLSLHRAKYRLARFHRYLGRRIMRLDPPYLVTVALCLALVCISLVTPWPRGPMAAVTAPQVVAHFGYVNAVLGYDWLNPVFWTLAIEFQFYVVIGLWFPLLAHTHGAVRTAATLVLCGLSLGPTSDAYLLPHLGFFLLGVIAFQLQHERAWRGACFFNLALVLVALWSVRGPVAAGMGLGTFAFILLGRSARVPRLFLWLGAISYSLYLLHVPIGMRVINLGARLEPTLPNVLGMLVLALVVSLGSAFALHRWVELPAQRWARRLGY